MVLFYERTANIFQELLCLQYACNVLLGTVTSYKLRAVTLHVFQRFCECEIQINFNKVTWTFQEIQLFGYTIGNG